MLYSTNGGNQEYKIQAAQAVVGWPIAILTCLVMLSAVMGS